MTEQGKTYFVAGTDTDVGKTLVAAGLLAAAVNKGVRALAIKPVAAGCEVTSEGLRNEDALKLIEQMNVELPYHEVNPVALEPAIAPHIAAEQIDTRLSLSALVEHCQRVLAGFDGFALIEGAGGWRLPLNSSEYLSGLPRQLDIPVVLVVGMKLGCLNHAQLTLEAIERDGLKVAGWVANGIDPEMCCFEENLASLKNSIKAPLLGVIPPIPGDNREQQAAAFMAVELLL